MKLQNLFEQSVTEGFYSTYTLTDAAIAVGKSILAEHPLVSIGGAYSPEVEDFISQSDTALLKFINAMKHETFEPINTKIIFTHLTTLTSFTQLPRKINSTLVFEDISFNSLKDINKHFTEIKGKFYIDGHKIKSHVLGLLLINGIEFISFGPNRGTQHPHIKVANILNDYIETRRRGEPKDVFECQEELIAAGLEEYAQI